jgi:hypothetical protein
MKTYLFHLMIFHSVLIGFIQFAINLEWFAQFNLGHNLDTLLLFIFECNNWVQFFLNVPKSFHNVTIFYPFYLVFFTM